MNEETREKLQRIINHPMRVPVAVGVTAFASGMGLGYILGKRQRYVVEQFPQQLEFDFDASKIADVVVTSVGDDPTYHQSDIDQLKEHYVEEEEDDQEDDRIEASDPTEEAVIPEEAYREIAASFVADRLQRTIEQRQASETPPEVEEATVDHNVFASSGDDGWDYEEELKKRSSSEPYVLHRDEFYADEVGYTQSTLTYFAGDDIMADEEDSPIYNYLQVTGELLFGHGSGDPNVVHVRNDKRRAEYEILRHEGLYSVEVLGLDIEDNVRVRNRPRDRDHDLKHSDYRKFKLE